jgi:hypothetical protein
MNKKEMAATPALKCESIFCGKTEWPLARDLPSQSCPEPVLYYPLP